jgi:hypothetical protein
MSETINDWENPHVFQRNREPAHVTLTPFADVASALAGDRLASPFFRLLNGDWRFTCAPRPEAVPADFHLPGYDASAWDDLPVPSNWQMHGYDQPRYMASDYGFDISRLPGVPLENPVGLYRQVFDIPQDWSAKRVFLVFDGVDSAFYVWVNGQMVGYSEDSRLPAEFDIRRMCSPARTGWRCRFIVGRTAATWKTRTCGSSAGSSGMSIASPRRSFTCATSGPGRSWTATLRRDLARAPEREELRRQDRERRCVELALYDPAGEPVFDAPPRFLHVRLAKRPCWSRAAGGGC